MKPIITKPSYDPINRNSKARQKKPFLHYRHHCLLLTLPALNVTINMALPTLNVTINMAQLDLIKFGKFYMHIAQKSKGRKWRRKVL